MDHDEKREADRAPQRAPAQRQTPERDSASVGRLAASSLTREPKQVGKWPGVAPTNAGALTVGETMLLLTGPGVGEVRDLEHMRIDTGGAESNVAAGLVRAGVPTTWVGRVGADPAGTRVLSDLRGAGINVVAAVDPDRSTGLMMKERLADGGTRVTYHRRHSAGSALRPADVPDGTVERAALVHLTGITVALSDDSCQTVSAVLDRAEAASVPVSFDVNHRRKLIDPDRARELYRAVISRSTVVFAGDDEARLVLGLEPGDGSDEDLAHGLAAMASGRAIVKLGSRGAVSAIDGQTIRRAATPVDVIDPVGAGDAFVAAWLAATLSGAQPEEALDKAADAGALACTVEGDWRLAAPASLHTTRNPDTGREVHDLVDR